MDLFEKNELKKEITTEVREDIARSTGKLITRRILLALLILMSELLLWAFVAASVVQDTTVRQGLLTCFIIASLRVSQAGLYSWFNEK